MPCRDKKAPEQMNPTDKDLLEQIRRHFNISPTASLTDPYPIRLVELLQYTKSIMPRELSDEEIVGIRMNTQGDIKSFAKELFKKSQEDRVVSHEEQEEWLRTVRKTGY